MSSVFNFGDLVSEEDTTKRKGRGKVIVAMSGGVDSSVAAALLKEQDYVVTGVTMKTWTGEPSLLDEKTRHGCYGPGEEEDIEDACKVTQVLGIPFYVFDLSKEFKSEVLDCFCQEYLSGRTPNPCIWCNRRIKLDALVKKARDSGIEFDHFATGHYARVEYDEIRSRYLLRKAKDMRKDQSYFLFALSQEQLRHLLLPVGYYTKEEVREMASCFGLGVESKPESQNFIAGGYSSLVKASACPGPILDKDGRILGEHQGIPFYTIGQRKGLRISAGAPLYVIDIDLESNAIVVGNKGQVYGDELVASELNWIAMAKLEQTITVRAKIRYLHQEAEAVIAPLDKDKVYIKFKQPQMAITRGQAIVFYDDDTVIGGGVIERTGR